MSYDFSFMRLLPRPREFPFKPPMQSEWSRMLTSDVLLGKAICDFYRERVGDPGDGIAGSPASLGRGFQRQLSTTASGNRDSRRHSALSKC